MSLGSVSQVKIKKDTSGIVLKQSTPSTDRANVESVLYKLQKLPQYSKSSRLQKLKLASKLTSSLDMTKYFSEYLQKGSSVEETRVIVKEDGSLVAEGSDGITGIHIEDRQELIETLSNFSVKLHITSQQGESIHLSLQVDSQLIEWTPQDVIIPHQDIPVQTLVTIDLSQCLMKTLVCRESHFVHAESSDELGDCIRKLQNARKCLIEHIVKQITIFNRYYSYQAGIRDSQNFIMNLFGALSIDTLPPLTRAVVEYIGSGKDLVLGREHKEIDDYVLKNEHSMSSGLMEYVALMYYKEHLSARAKSDDAGSETWKCPVERCQLRNVLLKLIK